MRKKNWLIGSVAAAAVVICGAVGINSVKAADTDAAKSAKEEFVYEQVGLDSYDSVYTGKSTTWLTSEDDKKISIIGKDGSIYSIDNTDGKYGKIAVTTSTNDLYDGYIYTSDKDNKSTLLNLDGSYVANNGGYHDNVYILTLGGTKYFEFVDGNKTVVKSEDGTDITAKIADGKQIKYVSTIANVYLVFGYADGSKSYYDANLNSIDFEGKVAQNGYQYAYAYKYDKNYIVVNYYKEDDKNQRRVTYEKYYDYSLNEYKDAPPCIYYSPIAGSVPKYESPDRVVTADDGKIFANENRLSHSESEKYSLEDDYTAAYTGVLLGYKVVLGNKTIDTSSKKTIAYALFDENGVKLLDNVMQYSRVDKLIVKEDGKYKIYKVSLKSESGETNITVDENKNSVAEVVAKEVDERELKDENGNKITVDDLDTDAKAVMKQKFDFKLVAAENVIPEGTKLSVSKVVAGKEYAAAKTVTAEVAERVAVFNIDLLNAENVKVQPNGKLEITTDVPTGYDVNRIAVYRLSEDETSYIKLESKVVDGKVVFETDHFSTYMIVEEKAEVTENPIINDDNQAAPSDDGTKGGNVQTGDIPMAGIIALIAVLALAGVSLVVSSKKARV